MRRLGAYLAGEQAEGRVRADVDPYAVALLFVGNCFTRSSQRQMPTHRAELPPLADAIDALTTMLEPTAD